MMEVEIEKLVHGGQGFGTLADGRKVFVWGALPGEKVLVRIIKGKRSYAEAIAEKVLQPSSVRVEPRENNYLATSPWQIVTFAAENNYKKRIISELFTQAHVVLPDFDMNATGDEWHYRNKMEYSFWGDDEGLHLALHNRGSHQKTIVQGSELALPAVDTAARGVVEELSRHAIRAGELKTVIVRCTQDGVAVASLFVKGQNFPELHLPAELKGLRVFYSDPRSPAAVPTKLLYELGDCRLRDALLGQQFVYDADSFFQVNLPVFETALRRIKKHILRDEALVDMYAGTGSIGLSVASKSVELIELDPATAAMARMNAAESHLAAEVVEVSTEKALERIAGDKTIIFDPPRAGLHSKVVTRVLETLPPQVVYLSCNPATQARDIAALQAAYQISYFEGFNFFPHTPHIETLAILEQSNGGAHSKL
ncbi:MAG TPA: TRAM domain-containing protein [Candidatus Saccharimonadales bacterium]|nr:TRAM domain-containing protein [Candidatus Saccharimonadales bacterium]